MLASHGVEARHADALFAEIMEAAEDEVLRGGANPAASPQKPADDVGRVIGEVRGGRIATDGHSAQKACS